MEIFRRMWRLRIEVLRESEYGSALIIVFPRDPSSQIFELRFFSLIFVTSKLMEFSIFGGKLISEMENFSLKIWNIMKIRIKWPDVFRWSTLRPTYTHPTQLPLIS